MYSYEIDNILKENNYLISTKIYLKIISTSNQIFSINYNPYTNSFILKTKDGYIWNFKVS